jgi:hypothetical protein
VRTETEGPTRRIVFDVQATGGPAAVLNLVPGEAPSGLYLWLGAPNDGPCIGTLAGAELKGLARAILREFARKR